MDFDISSPLTYGTPSSRIEGTPRSGVRGTPVRQRPDLGSVRKARQVDLHSDVVGISDFASDISVICIFTQRKFHSLNSVELFI